MQPEESISVYEFCNHQQIDVSFVHTLYNRGLIQLQEIDEKYFLLREQLPHVEKMARLHFDLDINMAGIESITHLLNRIQAMQQQITEMHNRLIFYEEIEEVINPE